MEQSEHGIPLRWGIIGVSKISHDFCLALGSSITPAEHQVVAVASRSQENANTFAKRHNIPTAYGRYIDLAKDANVEVAYVTVLNPQHYDVCKIMIEHGKHVVCEKPFAMNYAQAQEIIDLASEHRVFIMEGLWSRFFPVYRHLSRSIDMKRFENITEIRINHGFDGTRSQRIITKEMGGGIVLDIGCYAIQFVLFVFGGDEPQTIQAKGLLNKDNVDIQFEAVMTFSEGRKAHILCSGLEELENQATITTTKGEICIPTYWCPTRYTALGQMFEWNFAHIPEMNYTNSVGLKYEADNVSKCIRSGRLYCDIVRPGDTLIIAKIQDEIRKQIGVRYECDKIVS